MLACQLLLIVGLGTQLVHSSAVVWAAATIILQCNILAISNTTHPVLDKCVLIWLSLTKWLLIFTGYELRVLEIYCGEYNNDNFNTIPTQLNLCGLRVVVFTS